MKRRLFIFSSVNVILGLVLFRCSKNSSNVTVSSKVQSLSPFWNDENTSIIGNTYRSSLTEEELISQTLKAEELNLLSVSEIESRVHEDYESKNTFFVNSWLISESEALLCLIG